MFIHLRLILCLLLVGLSSNSFAHKYFVSLTELSINPVNQQLEVIHTITEHDLENEIANKLHINFSSAHDQYQEIIYQYLAQHFEIKYKNKRVHLKNIGIERVKGKIIIYQENKNQFFLDGLLVKNDLLVDTYAKQINTVNYQDAAINGSLIFDKNHRILKIK